MRHLREWEWLGYHEIMGSRRRYRLLYLDQLCWRVQASTVDDLQKNLERSLADMIAGDELKRMAHWTESIAVGSEPFLGRIEPLILSRREMETEQVAGNLWALHEELMPYGQKARSKIACKPRKRAQILHNNL